MLISKQHCSCLRALHLLAEGAGVRLFLVGGAVRDLLRGHPLCDSDLDILVEGDAAQFAPKVASLFGGQIKVFQKFYTAKLINPSLYQTIAEIDFASSRTEVYESPGALPTVSLSSLAEDLRRRDFSINSIGLSLEYFARLDEKTEITPPTLRDSLIDPFHGSEDLDERLIRILHRRSFFDDPTRLFRALRYEVRISGSLESVTKEEFERAVIEGTTNTISLKRRFNELIKILSEERVSVILERAITTGLLAQIFSPFQIDGGAFAQQISKILSLGQLSIPLSHLSAERLLLLTLIRNWPISEVEPVLQALAISKKLRQELRSELMLTSDESKNKIISPEARAVVGVSDNSW